MPVRILVSVLVSLAVWYLGLPLARFYVYRHFVLSFKHLSLTPQSLPESTVEDASGAQIFARGIQFEAPWRIERQRDLSNSSILEFQSGPVMTVTSGTSLLSVVQDSQGILPKLLPHNAWSSDYVLESTVLNTTPDSVGYIPTEKSAATLMLLTFKGTELSTFEGPIYSFEYANVRGFQQGEAARSKVIHLILFDTSGRRIEISILAKKEASAVVSQGAINRIVKTFKIADSPVQAAALP